MYWEEQQSANSNDIDKGVVDLVFGIVCRCLPVDHAAALFGAIESVLPWIVNEEFTGVHTIHVAQTGNGWVRPEAPDALLHLSRRTKFVLRVPAHRIDDGKTLIGQSVDVMGHSLEFKTVRERFMRQHPAVFARYVSSGGDLDEAAFLDVMAVELNTMGIKPTKMLCGMERLIHVVNGDIKTRSLMIADLQPEDAVKLQKHGLGSYRYLGCGLFLPHKDIKEIGEVIG